MVGDEAVLLFSGGVVTLFAWGRWYLDLLAVQRSAANPRGRTLLLVTPLIALGLLLVSLLTVAAHDVRDDTLYIAFYLVLGAAWIAFAMTYLVPFLGISARDDVIERANPAATYAISGALFGVTLAFLGGNIGDGPGWWVVLFSGGLATTALFGIWLILEWFSQISDTVTIDRDTAAGIRLGAFLVACGAIFGRAAAGNWVSYASTLSDFAIIGAHALPLLPAALLMERIARPRPERPVAAVFSHGIVPAILYLGFAGLSLLLSGMPA